MCIVPEARVDKGWCTLRMAWQDGLAKTPLTVTLIDVGALKRSNQISPKLKNLRAKSRGGRGGSFGQIHPHPSPPRRFDLPSLVKHLFHVMDRDPSLPRLRLAVHPGKDRSWRVTHTVAMHSDHARRTDKLQHCITRSNSDEHTAKGTERIRNRDKSRQKQENQAA